MRRYKALDMVTLAEGEVHIKDYHCSELNFPACAGFLRVTNRRVIFYGFPVEGVSFIKSIWREITGSIKHTKIDVDFLPSEDKNAASARLVNETYLEGINSVSSFYGKKILIIPFILSWLIGVAPFIWVILLSMSIERLSPFMSPLQTAGAIIAIIIGIVLNIGLAVFVWRLSIRKIFSLKIYGASAHDPISIGEGYRTLLGADKVFAITARPSEHTNEMMLELGTLISDLNKGGMGYERAIAKWQAIWEKGKPAETQPLTVSGDTPIAKKKLK